MSRIYDALRRGRSPAGPSAAVRTANPDAVLTALGYTSDRQRRSHAGLVLGTIAFGLVAAEIWWLLPGAVSPQARAGAGPVMKPVESKPSDPRPAESKAPET